MRRLVPLCLLVAACGGGDPKSPSDVDVGKVKGDSTVGAAGTHGPSTDLAARWPLGAKPPRYVYADLGALGSTELMKGVESLMSISEIPEEPRACGKALIRHSKELLAGESAESETFVVMRIEGDEIKTACLPLVSSGHKVVEHVKDATLVTTGERETFAFLPGWVLVGNRKNVDAAIASKGSGLPAIHLADGEMVLAHGTKPGGLTFDGTLLMNKERLKAAVDLSGAPDDLPVIESMLVSGKKEGAEIGKNPKMTKDERAIFDHIIQSFTFSRTDQKLHVQLDLVEDSVAQTRDIALLATLGVYGVRKYLSNAKQAEALNTLGQMGRDVAAWYEGEETGPGGTLIGPGNKKLFSIPPTPKTVPKGVKYQSQKADWKPWEKLRFEMDSPQYFQYEVRAAKDGQSADIIARGDLNGDGKTSEFVLHVTIDNAHLLLAPSIKQTNPDE